MKRRIFTLFSAILICFNMVFFSGATYLVESNQTITYQVSYLDDIEIETITVIYEPLTRASTRHAERTSVYKVDGVEVASVTFSVTFGYDGSTAWVESASGSHTTSGGWSYKNEEITTSGGTAKLTAQLIKLLTKTADVSITLTCSPTGNIS